MVSVIYQEDLTRVDPVLADQVEKNTIELKTLHYTQSTEVKGHQRAKEVKEDMTHKRGMVSRQHGCVAGGPFLSVRAGGVV